MNSEAPPPSQALEEGEASDGHLDLKDSLLYDRHAAPIMYVMLGHKDLPNSCPKLFVTDLYVKELEGT